MFGHRSFLHIGSLSDSSIRGLLTEGMELDNFSYAFDQAVDIRGKAQGEVHSGTLQLTYPHLPPNEIIDWMLNPRKYKDGVIVLCDMDDVPIQKISFSQAACIGLEINYSEAGNNYVSTSFCLRAKALTIGETVVENRWINI